MNKDYMTILDETGIFDKIDLHFARFIAGIAKDNATEIILGAAMASRVIRNGDVCLDLAGFAEKKITEKLPAEDLQETDVVCPDLDLWIKSLTNCAAVGIPGDYAPLILDGARLYFYRYWEYEKKLADSIKQRISKYAQINCSPDLNITKKVIKRYFPQIIQNDIDWQRIAALISLYKNFCVISGGPGTGKTYTLTKILAVLLELIDKKKLRIFLAAPTGKAAARLSELIEKGKRSLICADSIKDSIPARASTIHRLLKTKRHTPYFHYNSQNQLPADVVVVDEASMVDIALMSKLVQAVPVDAKLILVGDKDQIASVEAGSVLGDICGEENGSYFSKGFCEYVYSITGEDISASSVDFDNNKLQSHTSLIDSIVYLKKSYRFEGSGQIGDFGRAVNCGDVKKALSLFNKKDVIKKKISSPKDLQKSLADIVIENYSEYLKSDDPVEALEKFNRFKILCPVKKGPFGVDAINRLVGKILTDRGLIRKDESASNRWYMKKPVLITRNDYNLDLYNGDIGIIMPLPGSKNDELCAFFTGQSKEPRHFLPQLLPEHETVYAMTVHKSQGSEFDEVLLILPERDYPVLTRELIYTGVTRAKKKVLIWGTEDILISSILREIKRSSGLRDYLWGG